MLNSFFKKLPLSVTCARVYRIKCTTYALCTDSSSKSVSFLEFTTASSTCPILFYFASCQKHTNSLNSFEVANSFRPCIGIYPLRWSPWWPCEEVALILLFSGDTLVTLVKISFLTTSSTFRHLSWTCVDNNSVNSYTIFSSMASSFGWLSHQKNI